MRPRLASAAVAVALLGGTAVPAVVTAPVAAAHSVLLSVEPADGATVDASPDRVTLTFNEEINPSFATVAVNGSARDGSKVEGQPVVTGPVVEARLGTLDDDEYTVGYRVTSADGHVITGSSRFTVGAGAAAAGSATPAATGAAGASESAPADASPDPASSDTEQSGSAVGPALWVVAGLAVLLIAAAALLLRRGGRAD